MNFSLNAHRPLAGVRILLGITGSVAACKAHRIISLLQASGARVQVLLSENGARFFPPETAGALTELPVISDLWANKKSGEMVHLDAARAADFLLVAPATLNRLLQLQNPDAADTFNTVVAAYEGPRLYAPAMNSRMWKSEKCQQVAVEFSQDIVPPAEGALACGESGPGRLASPELIVDSVVRRLWPSPLQGHNWIVSGGPTREAWDSIRYLSNRSSGRMGEAIARVGSFLGAGVTLVTGAQRRYYSPGFYKKINIETAEELLKVVKNKLSKNTGYISAAAVADYRPQPVEGKISSGKDNLQIELEKTPDILASLRREYPEIPLVGFSADESQNTEKAEKKVEEKGLDGIVHNWINQSDGAFSSRLNEATFITPETEPSKTGRLEKNELALQLWLWLLEANILP
ncbi:MAG: bifunctional phosphopantothenoylcysteine decarboxylase/phosphopantothenate--cysteine ligase CoaBC [bacterium]